MLKLDHLSNVNMKYSLVCVCQFHDLWWHGQPSQQLASLRKVTSVWV
jgi:hypothetical protein